jgi:anti-sigma B factor antagonist
MEIVTKDEPDYHTIKVIGDLDASSSIILDDAIEKAVMGGKSNLLFDCQELNYISSPGIGVFTSRIEDNEKQKVTLVLFGVSAKVFNVFKILGLDQLLAFAEDEQEAKKYIDDLHNNGKL